MMDRKEYSAKMLTMLGDRDTYQLMAKDPTTSLENRMNRMNRPPTQISICAFTPTTLQDVHTIGINLAT